MQPATDLAAHLAGFVAGDGCFSRSGPGQRTRFRFSVGLGAADRQSCEILHDLQPTVTGIGGLFGVGSLVEYPRRRPHYDDEIAFVVQRQRDLVEVIVPFMDEHLPASYKRQQYLAWRQGLLAHWLNGPRRPRPCCTEGCQEPRHARGLCRRCHYAVHGS